MWDDFQIGDKDRNNTAVRVPGYSVLSQSGMCYWWESREFGVGGRINKKSPAGEYIAKRIQDGISDDEMNLCVLRMGLENMSGPRLVQVLESTRVQAFKSGQESKMNEIRACLGIESY